MKIKADLPPASEATVYRPWLKTVGLIIGVATIALIAFDDYWPPYLQSILLDLGVNQAKADNLVRLAGYLYLLGIAVGGFLMFKSRERPLYPTKDDVRDGKF